MRLFRVLPFFLAMPALVHGAVETFVETFNGDGPYQSLTNDLVGFDNPGWEVYSDDGFAAGGFYIQNNGEGEDHESDVLERTLSGIGSFRLRVELNDLDLGDFGELPSPDASGQFGLHLRLHEDLDIGRDAISLSLQESMSEEPVWSFRGLSSRNETGSHTVARGARVAMEVIFDSTSSEVTFTYDNDTADTVAPLHVGPVQYSGQVQETQLMTIVSSSGGEGRFDGILDYLSVTPLSNVQGDFNGNGILDAADIDQFSAELRAGSSDLLYDLNADSVVDDLDRQTWVHNLKRTFFGDADLSGTFGSTDLVQVLASGEYEDDVELNSTWLTGDWNGDGDFTSGDLVVALADGGYAAGAAAVPEPAGVVLAMASAALVAMRRRKRSKTHRA